MEGLGLGNPVILYFSLLSLTKGYINLHLTIHLLFKGRLYTWNHCSFATLCILYKYQVPIYRVNHLVCEQLNAEILYGNPKIRIHRNASHFRFSDICFLVAFFFIITTVRYAVCFRQVI